MRACSGKLTPRKAAARSSREHPTGTDKHPHGDGTAFNWKTSRHYRNNCSATPSFSMGDSSPELFVPPLLDEYAEPPQDDFSSWIPGQTESFVPLVPHASVDAYLHSSLASLVHPDKPLVIGVWGPSGGGKSSVAKWLVSQFPCSAHIAMDDFAYASREDIAAAGGDASHPHPFEAPQGYNKELFMSRVREVMAPGRCLVVEGILLFWWPEIAELCNIRFEMQAPQDVCRERECQSVCLPHCVLSCALMSFTGRSKRSLERNPSMYLPERYAAGGWYDSVVWKYYLEFADTIRGNSEGCPGKHFIVDGDGLPADVELRILAYLQQQAQDT